jgi:hypothetical protein
MQPHMIEGAIGRLKALCAAAAQFLEKPGLFRMKVQGEWMTREDVTNALRAATAGPGEGK